MANEDVTILTKGVKAWNKWRRKYPGIRPALSGAVLGGDLTGADLIEADLRGAYLG